VAGGAAGGKVQLELVVVDGDGGCVRVRVPAVGAAVRARVAVRVVPRARQQRVPVRAVAQRDRGDLVRRDVRERAVGFPALVVGGGCVAGDGGGGGLAGGAELDPAGFVGRRVSAVGVVFFFGVRVSAGEVVELADFDQLLFAFEGNHAVSAVAHVGLDAGGRVDHFATIEALVQVVNFVPQVGDETFSVNKIILLWDEHAVEAAHVLNI